MLFLSPSCPSRPTALSPSSQPEPIHPFTTTSRTSPPAIIKMPSTKIMITSLVSALALLDGALAGKFVMRNKAPYPVYYKAVRGADGNGPPDDSPIETCYPGQEYCTIREWYKYGVWPVSTRATGFLTTFSLPPQSEAQFADQLTRTTPHSHTMFRKTQTARTTTRCMPTWTPAQSPGTNFQRNREILSTAKSLLWLSRGLTVMMTGRSACLTGTVRRPRTNATRTTTSTSSWAVTISMIEPGLGDLRLERDERLGRNTRLHFGSGLLGNDES